MGDQAKPTVDLQTELERLRVRIEESEGSYRLHFENVSDVICAMDAQARIVNVSPSVRRMLGYDPDELVGRRIEELPLLDESDLARAMADIARVLGGQTVVDEFDLHARDGSIIRGQTSASPLVQHGRIVGIILVGRDVTDRWRTEQELRRSEASNRALIQAIPDSLYIFDRQGRYLGFKPPRGEGLGPLPGELVGRSLDDVLPDDLRERMLACLERAFATGQAQAIEYQFPAPWPDGPRRDYEARFVVGSQDQAIALVRDITARKQAEEDLRRSEAKHRALLSAMPDMIFRIGRDGVYREYIPAENLEPAIPLDTFLGRTVREVFPASFADQIMGLIERAFATRAIQVLEYRFPLPTTDGQERINELRMTVSGEDEVMVIVRNVTDRIRMEQDLRESEATLRAMLQGIPDELLHLNREGVYLAALPTRRYETSLDPTKSVGRTLWDVLSPVQADRFHQAIVRALHSGKVETVEYDVVLPGRRQRYREARLVAASADRVLVVVRDITDRVQGEQKERAYLEQLRSLASELSLAEERERRRIAAELHDHIGQTLALARIRLGALRALPLPPGMAEPLNEVSALVEQTIAETRSLTFQLSPPVLYELGFEAAAEWLADQVRRDYGIAVEVEAARRPQPMDDDVRIVLFAGLREVLLNAARHSHARLVKVRIRRRADKLHVLVSDDGVGFEPKSPPGEGPAQGSQTNGRGGFGLFSLHERLGHLGGTLHVRSAPGQGTEAVLVVPLRPSRTPKETP